MNYVLRSISESVESIFGSPDAHTQNYSRWDKDRNSDADDSEFPYSDKKTRVIYNYESLRDLEEGRSALRGGEPADEVKLDSKLYAHYLTTLLTMTCGFVASIFSFLDGMIFVMQCPENWILPCLLMFLGVLGTFSLLYIILKLLARDFDGFRREETILIRTSFVILVLLFLMDLSILYILDESYNSNSTVYCSPKFYGYTVITNLIAVLAFLFNYLLQYIHRKRMD